DQRPVGPPCTSTTNGRGCGDPAAGLSSAASTSMPSALAYLKISGFTTGIDDQDSLTCVIARALPSGVRIHNSGARAVVSPAKASVPFGDRAKTVGFVSRRSIGFDRPSRETMTISLEKPRATITASESLSIQ